MQRSAVTLAPKVNHTRLLYRLLNLQINMDLTIIMLFGTAKISKKLLDQ